MNDFEEIYNLYYKRLYLFVYKLSQNSFIAEEITQESFFQAFISFHRYDGTCEMFTWLASIAKNTYFKYLRKNKVTLQSIYEIVDYEYKTSNYDTEEKVLSKLLEKEVKKSIKKLPDNYQDVVILRTYADLSYAQIAKLLNISESSAKVIYFRAKNKLKEELSDART